MKRVMMCLGVLAAGTAGQAQALEAVAQTPVFKGASDGRTNAMMNCSRQKKFYNDVTNTCDDPDLSGMTLTKVSQRYVPPVTVNCPGADTGYCQQDFPLLNKDGLTQEVFESGDVTARIRFCAENQWHTVQLLWNISAPMQDLDTDVMNNGKWRTLRYAWDGKGKLTVWQASAFDNYCMVPGDVEVYHSTYKVLPPK